MEIGNLQGHHEPQPTFQGPHHQLTKCHAIQNPTKVEMQMRIILHCLTPPCKPKALAARREDSVRDDPKEVNELDFPGDRCQRKARTLIAKIDAQFHPE